MNIAKATEFVALNVYDKYFDFDKSDFPEARVSLEEDKNAILQAGKGKGEILTLINAFDIVNKTGFKAWFPVQAGVSNWMGDTKVKRKENILITQEQIKDILPVLEPGDILLERREWYLSNIGLPGFWTHVAFFVGTPEERKKIFDTDEVKDWVKKQGEASGDFEKLLKNKYPKAYELNMKPQENGHLPRVMEAIGEGVSFTTIEHSAAADSLGILRPKLSKKDIAVALLRAFNYSGRPYDFNFDFLTDASLVCSELTYKCYEPNNEYKGIKFNLVKMMGRLITPPNEIAHQFDLEYGTKDQQMDFVLFLDGYEMANKSINTNMEGFKESWKRPKWHILAQ